MQRHSFQAINATFIVDAEYIFVKELGQGAYGCVVAARHRKSGEGCAIKKITNINTKVRPVIPPSHIHLTISKEDPHEAMLERDKVHFGRVLQRRPLILGHLVSWFTSEDTRMYYSCHSVPPFPANTCFDRLHVCMTWILSFNPMGISMKYMFMYVDDTTFCCMSPTFDILGRAHGG